jgi:hypothetical protein
MNRYGSISDARFMPPKNEIIKPFLPYDYGRLQEYG